jgi:hypothetical protein
MCLDHFGFQSKLPSQIGRPCRDISRTGLQAVVNNHRLTGAQRVRFVVNNPRQSCGQRQRIGTTRQGDANNMTRHRVRVQTSSDRSHDC